ncbi:hypothetical protein V6N13_065265 [Hibiscus sabdariffa]|uniref:Bet v I/Major latex protein domain-containing protein n=1 Tax=Hibiscus sabdariffa TaxID=183260 RepID=A0ABR2QRD5_9ROSI
MGVFTYESEVITAIPPCKMFRACILDGDKLIPKVVPQAFKSVEYIQGNGEPGSIKKVTFGEGSQFEYMKQKVEALDEEKFAYTYSVIEGDALMNKLEKITYEMKMEASPDGGSVCKTTSKYYTIGDFELKEEGIKAGKEKALGMFKAIEAYLQANPDAY